MAGASYRVDRNKLTGWKAAFSLIHPQFLQLLRRAQSSRRSIIICTSPKAAFQAQSRQGYNKLHVAPKPRHPPALCKGRYPDWLLSKQPKLE